jgi:hypothetical protein
MERYMYQDDSFEQLLKQKADEYRMYPSDQSWQVIYQHLHQPGHFSWKLFTLFSIVLLSAGLWVSVNQHEVKPVALGDVSLLKSEALNNNLKIAKPKLTKKKIISFSNSTVVARKDISNTIQVKNISDLPAATDATEENTNNEETITNTVAFSEIVLKKTEAQELINQSIVPYANFAETATSASEANSSITATPELEQNENITDADLNYEVKVPVITAKKPTRQIQFYVTPSASYRVIVSDNKYNFGNIRNAKSAISHQPFIGMEAGVSFIQPISKSVAFTSGLQFNLTNYIVTGSKFSPEVATVTLGQFRNIQRVTSLRTRDGYFDENIPNRTYQVSLPIGLRISLLQPKKLSWDVATTIQPTYLISATGYLVTNDYKNYIKAPEFLKVFNLNYSLETFLRWRTGNSEFQLGPQFRYQLLSNSKENYPVKEHLVDYGFKIGFIKNLK